PVQSYDAGGVFDILAGAMADLEVGDPALLSPDVGQVIDEDARRLLEEHAARMDERARPIAQAPLGAGTEHGTFFAPRAWEIGALSELTREHFGPALHVIR